ncbi:hypothetical protein AVEN_96798-1 [Araneus ventricosus]|uniref:Uncharacterized protein n=1 Tax=Araneus ventricosus TaxID=182803 RepID=A0A4Y2U2X2_ARAVE|nr:hypothetical protein AVEN_96798-1 [Araneus ventricosus]
MVSFNMPINLVPIKGRMFLTAHASFQGGSGPDGTTHYGAQQGKAAAGSGHSQPWHLPCCYPGPIRSESPPGTSTTLNAKPQRMTLSLDL